MTESDAIAAITVVVMLAVFLAATLIAL